MVEGAYLLDISIAAGSLRSREAALADDRPEARQAVPPRAGKGSLHGKSLKLSRPKPGPPAHGAEAEQGSCSPDPTSRPGNDPGTPAT